MDTLANIPQVYARDGFVFPYDVVSQNDAKALRADLEAGEAELTDRPEELALLRSYPSQLLPSFNALIHHPRLIEAMSALLGPDLMVWGSGLFIKEANTKSHVSWHQDLNYWGLDDVKEVTAWVALCPTNVASGCMRFVAGSHTSDSVAHVDTFGENNLLTRGQELAVEVDESAAVDVILDPGQASLHHGHLFHSSAPNTTEDRRIGVAIRYIAPSMKQQTGDPSLVSLVSGKDDFGNFTVAEPPRGRLLSDDFALCRNDSAIKRRVLYEGAQSKAGTRYK
jgi:hypothetical protein